MFKVKRTLPLAEQIEIIAMGDLHNGSPNARFDKFQEQINYIKNTPNCYAIFMGDLLDAIVPSDKRYSATEPYRTIDTLKKEIYVALEPIKEKIIIMLTGNHEVKLDKQGYGCPIAWMCQELKVPYGGISAFIKLKCHPKTHEGDLTIYAYHGYSAGRKTGACVNNVENLAQYYDADIFLIGHSHKLVCTKQVMINYYGYKTKLFCNTGTFLETASYGTTGYGEIAGYPPLRLGCPKIKWFPKKRGQNIYASE